MNVTTERKALWARLREPFPAHQIGKLPRVTCGACREANSKVCGQHQKSSCSVCRNYITSAHMHLDYVGHAAVTDRIQEVDPEWTWAIRTIDEHGSPLIDRNGGIWIDITILGVTRPAYGDAEGKRGGDAVKAAISDAIKNGAMRFGVGLDLWSKEDLGEQTPAEPEPPKPAARSTRARKPSADAAQEIPWDQVPVTIKTLDELTAKARECDTVGAFKGAIKSAFVKRREQLMAELSDEERALTVVKDTVGATEVAS